MERLSTLPYFEYGLIETVPENKLNNRKSKWEDLFGFWCSKISNDKKSTSSYNIKWDEAISCEPKSTIGEFYLLKDSIKLYYDAISLYNLNNDVIFWNEDNNFDSLKSMKLLSDIAEGLFEGARERTEEEADSINTFVTSKSKILFSKQL